MDDQSLGDTRESSALCPACHAPVFAENNFCEACGHRICAAATAARSPAGPALAGRALTGQALTGGTVAGACTGCGATAIDVDGYCEQCGLRQPGERDHMELELTVAEGGVVAAGVTDKGHRHSKNEDAMALATVPGGAAVVVCDGVSSSPRPEDASQVAAKTGVSVLVRELESGADAETATREAVSQAAQAVTALAASEHEAPACTYVSALVRAGSAVVGWVGDSRAYWLPATPPTGLTGPPTGTAADRPAHRAIDQTADQTAHRAIDQTADQNPDHDSDRTADQSPGRPAGSGDGIRLTEDDSWAGQMVALGALSETQAQQHRNAHVLVGWLGADADAVEAHVRTFRPPVPGVLVVCSDGLWNYLPEASAIAGALAETLPGPPSGVSAAAARPLAAARSLVGIALDSGGRDNITVVVIPFCPAGPAGLVETPAQPTTEPTE